MNFQSPKQGQLPISKCQLRATASPALSGVSKDSSQLASLAIKIGNPTLLDEVSITNHLQPKLDLVGFVRCNTYLGCEFSSGSRLAGRTVVCGNRRSSAGNLIGENPSFDASRKSFGEGENSKSKLLTTFFKFLGVHRFDSYERRHNWEVLIGIWKLNIGERLGDQA